MAKPKRYSRARSPLHAMFLSNQGLPVRKLLHNDVIGPATPSRLIAVFCERYSFDDETTAKVLGLLNIAANGKAIKYGNRVAMIPVGQGRVVVQISRQRRNTDHSTGAIAPNRASTTTRLPLAVRSRRRRVTLPLLQETILAQSETEILHIAHAPETAALVPPLPLDTHAK